MSTTKKVLTAIFSVLIIGAFAFLLTWGIINWSKVKDGMAGNGLYTQDDVQNAYEDGYSTALTDKEEYDKLINSYRDTITTQNDLISQYTSEAASLNNSIKDYKAQVATLQEQKTALETQIETLKKVKSSNEATITELNGEIASLSNQVLALQANKDENERQITALTEQVTNLQTLNAQLQENNELNTRTINGLNSQVASLNNQIADLTLQAQNNSSTVNALNVKIAELQKSVSYYEQYLSTLENGEQVVATFEFDGSVYNIQIVNRNSILTVTTPTSTAYVIFNGWTVDGEPIDLATYRITQNTKIVANVTHKYEVNFMVDGVNHNSQIVLKDSKVTIPANPTKNGYLFEGWTIDGNNVVNLNTYTVTQNVTFTAKFTKLHSVVFKYEDTTLKNETVKSGNYATAPTVTSTAYKVFNGWKTNGVTVNISEYRITSDTVFIADITYKYDVIFTADGKTHNTQIVEKYGKPTVPDSPTKENCEFVGWSRDGKTVINVSEYTVTENVTFTAIFGREYFTENSPMFGKWLGVCVGDNADEGNNYVYHTLTKGNPLELKKVNSEQFSIMSTVGGQSPMLAPLNVTILEVTATTIKFYWTAYPAYVFNLTYDSETDTLIGTFERTVDGETTVYNIVYTRTNSTGINKMSGTFNYADYR